MAAELEENRESVNFGSACDARRSSKQTGPEIGRDRGAGGARAASCDGQRALRLGIRRDTGEMILREGQGALQIGQAINWLRHENAKGAHIYIRPAGMWRMQGRPLERERHSSCS